MAGRLRQALRLLAVIAVLQLCCLSAGTSHAAAQVTTQQRSVEQASFEEILYSEAPLNGWRAFEWQDFPGIYVIHFDTYLLQGKSLNRVAMFAEKAGQRGKVPTESELRENVEGQGFSMENIYAAHDYRSSDLARFFNNARDAGIPLFAEEEQILDWLEQNNLLIHDRARGGWRATGRHAVLSFATRYLGSEATGSLLGQPGRAWESRALYHETRHGLYFTRPEYRQRCLDFWDSRLTQSERQAFRLALSVFHYDPTDEELMVNEWMAYLLTPDYSSIGAQIFPQRLRAMAEGRLRPEGFGRSDAAVLERVGHTLAERVESSMVDELRDWLGSEWDIPRYEDVARIGMQAE